VQASLQPNHTVLVSLLIAMVLGPTTSQGEKVGGNADYSKIDWVRKAFESFDADKSGFIDPQELRAALTMLGVEVDFEKLKQMGVEDKDGDGELSLADLDKNNDNKIDFDEFKAIAHILPKREHAIYRGALHSDPITMPRDPTKESDVQRCRREAQQSTKTALNTVLGKLRTKMKLDTEKKLLNKNTLLRKFQELDVSGDARVNSKELEQYLREENPEITKMNAWLIMNCADTNNDQHMTFDEFQRMMTTVARGTLEGDK